MYARKQLDFSFRDLMAAVGHTLRLRLSRQRIADDLENLWSPDGDAVAALSVRTAFDAYLSVLNLPRGSEVVMTGINIPDMVQIVHEHGLSIVPVDLNMRTLEMKPHALKKAITANTRLVVAAHLFGARMDMEPVFRAIKNRQDIRVVEDCAQAFRGLDQYTGDARSDISLFSFGSIKTASALGGAMARVRDPEMRQALKRRLSGHPQRGRAGFIWRVIKYGCLKALGQPAIYGVFIRLCRMLKLDFDEIIIASVRNFKCDELLLHIRQQPSVPQLALLHRRLEQSRNGHLDTRIAAGNFARERLREFVDIHGADNPTHTYWLFPVRCADKDQLVADLQAGGFDATASSTQLQAIPPDHEQAATARECVDYINKTVYLPIYARLPRPKLEHMVEIIKASCSRMTCEISQTAEALPGNKPTRHRRATASRTA
jgi:dTDP-4-amino-4,6-dideoxygalactose transaminase